MPNASTSKLDIKFYHLQRQTLDEALPKLMERVQGAGLKAVVKVANDDVCTALDKALWSYREDSFLPHDKAGCDHPEDQIVYLTTGDENPNGSTCLVLVDAVESSDYAGYDRLMYMFDGRNADVVTKAREDWKTFKDGGFEMSYWQQTEQGGWEKKA